MSNENDRLVHIGDIDGMDDVLPGYLRFVEKLVESDDLELAEQALKCLPGFYRDQTPKEVLELRRAIDKYATTVNDYAQNPKDVELVNPARAKLLIKDCLRGQLICKEVQEMNASGKIPHIHEMGPGEFWIPIGLKEHLCKFTYSSVFLSQNSFNAAKVHLGDTLTDVPTDRPHIFVACEIIEHLRSINDIPQCMGRAGLDPVSIHLSTPLYTFGRGKPNWKDPSLVGTGAHVRTYTPIEFIRTAEQLFQGYRWQFCHAEIMSLVGHKPS